MNVVDFNTNVVDFNTNVVDFNNSVQADKLLVAKAEPELKPENANSVDHHTSSILPNPHNVKKIIE